MELFWRRHLAIAWLSGALAVWGIAVLSIWSVVGAISWDVAFVALSLACSLASLSFLYSGVSRKLLDRFYPMLMPVGPLILGAFPLFGLAPRIYCAILVIVVLAQTLVKILRSGGQLEWARREATGVCYLFIVMLLLLRLI